MRELVLVVSDLYLSRDEPAPPFPDAAGAPPGLQHVMRFGTVSKLADGWRAWLSRWLTGAETGAPASVAALAMPSNAALGSHAPPRPSRDRPIVIPSRQPESAGSMVWIATPVHLVTGVSSLHLDRRGLLRLDAAESSALAAAFGEIFHDSGFVLAPLESGDFLLFGPQLPVASELEPERALGESSSDALHSRASNPLLRRLSAEIEMWLHGHPVNDARMRRGEASVTGLWLWGGGTVPARHESPSQTPSAASSDIVFGRDAYVHGLCASIGKKVSPFPHQLAEVFGYAQARRAALVTDICSLLQAAPAWTLFDALTEIDRNFIAPAVQALGVQLERLVLVGNDREVTLRARDRFKLWRRRPVGLAGLQ